MQGFINVNYQNIDGFHVFSSDDVPGLYVAHTDPREAFECVSEGIALHLKLNEKRDVAVEPIMSVDEFMRWIGLDDSQMGIPHPAVIAARNVVFRPQTAG